MKSMKRWLFLLAFPYVVTVSSQAPCSRCDDVPPGMFCVQKMGCGTGYYELVVSTSGSRVFGTAHPTIFQCDIYENCDWLYDLAEALNQAHRAREERSCFAGPCSLPKDEPNEGDCLRAKDVERGIMEWRPCKE